jgi:hypothetical protein
MFVVRVIPHDASALDIFDPHCFGNWKPPPESRQVTGEADYTSLQVDESEYESEYQQYSDSVSDTTSYMTAASRSRN